MQRSTSLVLTFKAIDSRGNTHNLKVFAHIETASLPDGSTTTSRGRPSIETQNGLGVYRLAKGEYKVAVTGLLLHSDDPRAV